MRNRNNLNVWILFRYFPERFTELLPSRTIVTIAFSKYGLGLNLGSRLKQTRISKTWITRGVLLEIEFFLSRCIVIKTCIVFNQMFDFENNLVCTYKKYIFCVDSCNSVVDNHRVECIDVFATALKSPTVL